MRAAATVEVDVGAAVVLRGGQLTSARSTLSWARLGSSQKMASAPVACERPTARRIQSSIASARVMHLRGRRGRSRGRARAQGGEPTTGVRCREGQQDGRRHTPGAETTAGLGRDREARGEGCEGCAHPPEVALGHQMLGHHLAALVGYLHRAIFGQLKRRGVRAVLLSLLGHQTDVGDMAHGADVKLSVRAAVVEDRLVDARVGAVRDEAPGGVHPGSHEGRPAASAGRRTGGNAVL